MKRAILATLITSALLGCGGGGGDSKPTPQPDKPDTSIPWTPIEPGEPVNHSPEYSLKIIGANSDGSYSQGKTIDIVASYTDIDGNLKYGSIAVITPDGKKVELVKGKIDDNKDEQSAKYELKESGEYGIEIEVRDDELGVKGLEKITVKKSVSLIPLDPSEPIPPIEKLPSEFIGEMHQRGFTNDDINELCGDKYDAECRMKKGDALVKMTVFKDSILKAPLVDDTKMVATYTFNATDHVITFYSGYSLVLNEKVTNIKVQTEPMGGLTHQLNTPSYGEQELRGGYGGEYYGGTNEDYRMGIQGSFDNGGASDRELKLLKDALEEGGTIRPVSWISNYYTYTSDSVRVDLTPHPFVSITISDGTPQKAFLKKIFDVAY